MKKDLPIASIETKAKTQQRPLCDETVAEYQRLVKFGYKCTQEGEGFPPIEVFYDGSAYYLTDGFHRWHAHRKAGERYIAAIVTEGTYKDARWASYGANTKHGLPLKLGQKKTIVLNVVQDEDFKFVTDDQISKHVGVSRTYVGQVRRGLEKSNNDEKSTNANPCPQNQDNDEDQTDNNGSSSSDTGTSDQNGTVSQKKKVLDEVKKEVPKHLHDVFSRAKEIRDYIYTLQTMKKEIIEAHAKNDQLYTFLNSQRLEEDFGNLRRTLKFCLPYAVCPYCGGDENNDNCRSCDASGFLNEDRWNTTPEELKK